MDWLLRLIYPPLCRHCQVLLQDAHPLFCPACLDQLALLELSGRCPVCSREMGRGACSRCLKRRVILRRQYAAVEPFGPAATVLRLAKEGESKAIEAAAALMAYQYLKEEKILPDWIVPLPVSRFQILKKGMDPERELAKALSRILGVPLAPLLRCKGDWRHFLKTGDLLPFFYYCPQQICTAIDQRLLLCSFILDDVVLRRAGAALQGAFPAQMDALSFSH